MKSNFIILTFFLVFCSAYCQQNSKVFFPLAVSNKYVFTHSWLYPNGGGSIREISQILRDTNAFSKKYYLAVNFPFINNKWIRVDSITGSLYYLDISGTCLFYNHEMIIDSLRAMLNDSTQNCLSANSQLLCDDTSYLNIFGKSRQKKSFINDCSSPPTYFCTKTRTYLDSIGIWNFSQGSAVGGTYTTVTWTLRGGIINGIVFGDTSVIGITLISSEIPNRFSLLQNYPNPFNPTTKIRLELPKSSTAKLVVYDILGREVATLIDEELKPGSYEYSWDGSAYASGIYFYQLITDGNIIDTKKMVLMK